MSRFSDPSQRMLVVAAIYTSLLLLLSLAVHAAQYRLFPPTLNMEWHIWLSVLQIIGMGTIVRVWGRPRGLHGYAAFAGLNLLLLMISGLSLSNGFLDAVLWGVDFLVRLATGASWAFVAIGLVAALWRITRRGSGALRQPPLWIKCWLSTALFLGVLDVGARFVQPTKSPDGLSLPSGWPETREGPLLIAAIGGSTMLGYPYHPKVDIPTVLAAQLRQSFPDQAFEVRNLAVSGVNLPLAAARLKQFDRKPDLLLVYTGHNEFYHGHDAILRTASSTLPLFDGLFQWSAAYRALAELVCRLPAAERPHSGLDGIIAAATFTPRMLSRRKDSFREQVRQLAEFCRREKIFTVWFLPAASEGVFEPNRSVADRPLSEQEHTRLASELDRARQFAQQHQFREAADVYQRLTDAFPTLAEIHFRLGECQVALEDYNGARTSFRRATDCDGYPVQVVTSYREILQTAAEQSSIPLIDAETVLRPLTPHGLLDRSVIHDHVHPTLRGYFALGMAVAQLPVVQEWVGESQQTSAKRRESTGAGSRLVLDSGLSTLDSTELDFGEFLKRQNMTADDLALAYERTAYSLDYSVHHRWLPTRRKEEARQYRQWAQALRRGTIQPGDDGTESFESSAPAGVVLSAGTQ